jgi:hypothetical protein
LAACSRIRSELDFRCRVDPGAWGVAPPPRPNVDFVVNSALLVKTRQVRQQGGGLRELHRFWCWPRRSSHGRDQLGYQPCTLTPGPAPKSTTTLFDIDSQSVLPLIVSPEIARRSSQKSERLRVKLERRGCSFSRKLSECARVLASLWKVAHSFERDARTHRTLKALRQIGRSPQMRTRSPSTR